MIYFLCTYSAQSLYYDPEEEESKERVVRKI